MQSIEQPTPSDRRLNSAEAAKFLSDALGRRVVIGTLANWRCKRDRGPAFEYFGTVPVYRVSELQRWVDNDAFKKSSPLLRNRAARSAAAPTEPGAPA